MSRNYKAIADKYANGVLAGNVRASQLIKLACQRYLDDLDAAEWVFSEEHASYACAVIEMFPHVQGPLAAKGALLVLEPWQVFATVNIFGFLDANGLRRYREAFMLIPRKQGKSTWAAAVANFMAFVDGEVGAQVWIGANSEAQANYVFEPAQQMAATPAFCEAFGVEVSAKSITQMLPNGRKNYVQRQIGKPRDGGNPHCAILDEAHEAETSHAYDAMKTGMGARAQPLLLTITTAGMNTGGPCYLQQKFAEAVLRGQTDNPQLFAMIFGIDPDDDWRDFDCWLKANPNAGVSVSIEYLREQHRTALQRPEKAAANRTKHLNVWVSSSSAWVNMADWAKAANPKLDINDFAGCTATIAADLATKSDLAAVVVRVVKPDGRVAFFPFLFLPESALDRAKNAEAYRQWNDMGHMIVTDGEATDFSVIEDKIRELCKLLNVTKIGFDAFMGTQMMQQLMSDGLPAIICPQNTKTYAPAMRDFEALLLEGKLEHPDNQCLNWMAGNVVSKEDAGGNHYPKKEQDHLKIDGMVAAFMAEALAAEPVVEQSLPYIGAW